MSSTMTRLFRVPRMAQFISRRGMSSDVARTELSPMDMAIGFTTLMMVFLVPSGFILSNLEEYKRRE